MPGEIIPREEKILLFWYLVCLENYHYREREQGMASSPTTCSHCCPCYLHSLFPGVPGAARSTTAMATKNTDAFCTTHMPFSSSIRDKVLTRRQCKCVSAGFRRDAWVGRRRQRVPPEAMGPGSCSTSRCADTSPDLSSVFYCKCR